MDWTSVKNGILRTLLSVFCVVAMSCGGDDGGDGSVAMCDPTGESRLTVLRTIAFILEDPAGVAEGFNLDNVVSDGSEDATCMQADLMSPDGEPGIDNSLASLWANLQMLSPDLVAVDSLIQGAIDDGQLLLLMELGGVDDPMNDDCVNITIRRGTGMPMLGTDGLITSGQTFDVDTSAPTSMVGGATIVDGVVEGGPFELQLPVRVFDLEFVMTVSDARLRFTLGSDGTMSGFFGGAVSWQQIMDAIEDRGDIPGSTKSLVRNQLMANADLSPDGSGKCQQITAGMNFQGVSAFVFE